MLKHNYVKTNECRSILAAAEIYANDSSFWQYKPFVDAKAFLAGTSSNLHEVVEIDEFAVFPLPYLRKFQK